MRALDIGQKRMAYTGVIVHAGQTEDGQEIDYSVGNDSGSVLEVNVPNGSYALACALLDKLKLRGYRYQPFEADGAIADPAIEIGDNITANNVSSIVMGINTNHSRLMASNLKAPFDEEVNHEWKYVPRFDRQFKRESAYTRSRLTITEGQISAEVVRATNAETQLSSRITINATEIAAKVSKTGGSSQSFGWSLTDSSWTLTSNNSTVLRATSSGIEVTGKIVATSGNIGGAVIENGVLTVENANIGSINGSKVIDNTMNGSKLVDNSIGRYKYGTGSVYGGSGGAIASGTVAYGNVGFTGTLDQVGTNRSNIEAMQGYFTGSATFSNLKASVIWLDNKSLYFDSQNYVRGATYD